MAAPWLAARRVTLLLWISAAACAGPANDFVITKHDFAGTAGDLAGADLIGADLTGFPPGDMPSGDMVRLTWTDKSFATTDVLWSVWSDGTSVWAVGDNSPTSDTGILLRSPNGTSFASDPAAQPPGKPPLYGIFGVAAGPPSNPLLTVGRSGAVWSYGNTPAPSGTWSALPNTGTNNYTFAWIAPDGVAFLVGQGNVAKKQNGANWDDITGISDFASGVWGVKTASGYTVYACGGGGSIWKYTGTTFVAENTGLGVFTPPPPAAPTPRYPTVYGIYGFNENDIYAVTENGIIMHSIGNGSWQMQTSGVTTSLNAIGGASADEVYAVGDNGVVLHKYGASSTTWVPETLPNPSESRNFVAVWADAAKVWVTGYAGAILTK
jgi:hypothetical protein